MSPSKRFCGFCLLRGDCPCQGMSKVLCDRGRC